jgi:hypothetical protein
VPPLPVSLLPTSAKHRAIKKIRTPQIKKQMMAAAPKCSATNAGNVNIPVPIVIFTTAQANPNTPIVRFRSAPVCKLLIEWYDDYLIKAENYLYSFLSARGLAHRQVQI